MVSNWPVGKGEGEKKREMYSWEGAIIKSQEQLNASGVTKSVKEIQCAVEPTM